jgi:sigma-B regulation protein RsbU (phosphoserine phosphatase)
MSEGASREERLRQLLEDFSSIGLRFRLVLIDGESHELLYNGLGDGALNSTFEESWPVAESLTIQARLIQPTNPFGASALKLMASCVPAVIRMERELLFFRSQLASRHGEVALLTNVGETLGSGILLERGVARLLAELVEVMDASSGELWTIDDSGSHLSRFAASDSSAGGASIDLELSRSPLTEVFRSQTARAVSLEDGTELLVPVRHSQVHGLSGSMGVLRIRPGPDRDLQPSDLRLVSAIASQIGAAFENRRLTGESVERERMLVELELAHHLQLKLLPELADFADFGDIAARCEPAESVGGDFYHLFRLGEGRIGVMLGDVSSHGYSAGLIMALTMSAASLVVRESDRPGDVLRGIHQELVRKLESTDMYMTLCYVVVDPMRNRLRYANAGHPHAFRIGPAAADRLEALNPPLGIAEFDTYEEREVPWHPGKDTLLLFTDGLSETMRADRIWSDDLIIDAVRRYAESSSGHVLDELFRIASPGDTPAPDDRTALVLKQ